MLVHKASIQMHSFAREDEQAMTIYGRRTFPQRIGLHWPCVAPATILSGESFKEEDGTLLQSLRSVASHDGLCFLRVIKPFYDGTYLAQVAASLDLLDEQSDTVVFTEEQLLSAFPHDCRVEGRIGQQEGTQSGVQTLLCAHALEMQPLQPTDPEHGCQPLQSDPIPVPLEPLEIPVEIQAEDVPMILAAGADVMALVEQGFRGHALALQRAVFDKVSKRTGSFSRQQAFLHALLDNLMDRLYAGIAQAKALVLKACCSLVARVQRWHRQNRQRIVQVLPIFLAQQVLWRLIIGIPWQRGNDA
jgi:hypothetical protein